MTNHRQPEEKSEELKKKAHKHSMFPMPLKFFLIATVAVCIFAVALAGETQSQFLRIKNGVQAIQGYSWGENEHYSRNMMWGGRGRMMPNQPVEQKAPTQIVRWFGNITQIQGNKITILDNAGQTQTVVSQSTTSIMSPTGEVGLATLKAGMNIVSVGTLNAENQLVATVIKSL